MKRRMMMLGCCLMLSAFFTGSVYAEESAETELSTEEIADEAETEEEVSDWQAMINQTLEAITGDYEYTETEVTCERDGMTLRGTLTMPVLEDGESAPIVILSHGFTSSQSEMIYLAKGYAVNGIASVRFDFMGSGSSDGESTDMSVLTEVEDLNVILDYVMTLDGVDTDHIFLSGNSMGGLVSAITAAQREDDIEALILNYPAFSIPDDLRAGHVQAYEFDVDDIPETIDMGYFVVGSAYITDAIDMDPYELACGFSKDVLLFHGDADTMVDISYSERAAEEYASVEFVVVEGGGHGFYGEQLLEQIDKSVAFVEEEIGE